MTTDLACENCKGELFHAMFHRVSGEEIVELLCANCKRPIRYHVKW